MTTGQWQQTTLVTVRGELFKLQGLQAQGCGIESTMLIADITMTRISTVVYLLNRYFLGAIHNHRR